MQSSATNHPKFLVYGTVLEEAYSLLQFQWVILSTLNIYEHGAKENIERNRQREPAV